MPNSLKAIPSTATALFRFYAAKKMLYANGSSATSPINASSAPAATYSKENSPGEFGTLFDCGDSRNGAGYRDVTNSTDPAVQKIKTEFLEILEHKADARNDRRRKRTPPRTPAKSKGPRLNGRGEQS